MNHQHVTQHGRLGVGARVHGPHALVRSRTRDGTTLPAAIDTIRPAEGGIHPREAQIITAMLRRLAEHLARTS